MLWTAIACMQRDCGPDTLFLVYTGDVGPGKATKEQVLDKAEVRLLRRTSESVRRLQADIRDDGQARFGIRINPTSVAFVPLRHRWLVEDSTWPRLTLLGQSLGSVLLAIEGLFSNDGVVPDVWIGEYNRPSSFPPWLCLDRF